MSKTSSVSLLQIGYSNVGKTSLSYRFTNNTFNPYLLNTVGLDYFTKKITHAGKNILVKIWDTVGQERYHNISFQFIRKAEGIMFVYDITKKEKFDSIVDTIKDILHYNNKICYILIGNKCDCSEEEREVSFSEGKSLADSIGIKFYETSALNGENVKESFYALVNLVINKRDDLKEELLDQLMIGKKNNEDPNQSVTYFTLETAVNENDYMFNANVKGEEKCSC